MTPDRFAPLRELAQEAATLDLDWATAISASDARLLAALLREHDEAVSLLAEFVDDDPCDYDHHGYCQTHRLGSRPCETERARALLRSLAVADPTTPPNDAT